MRMRMRACEESTRAATTVWIHVDVPYFATTMRCIHMEAGRSPPPARHLHQRSASAGGTRPCAWTRVALALSAASDQAAHRPRIFRRLALLARFFCPAASSSSAAATSLASAEDAAALAAAASACFDCLGH